MNRFILDVKHPQKYQEAKPFSHIIIDDFLPYEMASRIEEGFSEINVTKDWYFYDNLFEKKLATDKLELMPTVIRQAMYELNSGPFVSYLQELTGIKGLISDSHLRGGGIHLLELGGKLDIHSDRGIAPHLDLYRRLNCIIFFNRNWKPGMGGELELWNGDMTKCEQSIDPTYNRAVIFNTDATSFHGVPDLWLSKDYRKSLATYYYSAKVPEDFKANLESTDFRARPKDPIDITKDALRAERRKLRL